MGWLSNAATSVWIVRGALLALGLPLLVAIYRWAAASVLFDDLADPGPVPSNRESHAA
jgi:hypothetical protein